jgi:hypothetical protein
MPLKRRAEPFDHPDWIFEAKLDGFRALAYPIVLALRWHLVRGSLSSTGSTLDMTSRALAYELHRIVSWYPYRGNC